jgi:hypothetical membrane protein
VVTDALLPRIAPRAGLLGAATIGVCAFLAAVAYRGTAGEAYSPLNHFVSELGEPGVSALGFVFNAGLIVGGLCFGAFLLGLGEARGGPLAAAYGVIGGIAGLAGALVGVFPVTQLQAHTLAAATYFNLGWISIALATLDVLLRPDPRFPGWLALPGFISVTLFLGFIAAYASRTQSGGNGLEPPTTRAGLDPVTIFEWLAVLGSLAWTALTAGAWARAERRRVEAA